MALVGSDGFRDAVQGWQEISSASLFKSPDFTMARGCVLMNASLPLISG